MQQQVKRKPKKVTSNRVCPECGDRGTKIFNLNTGLYQCQVCNTKYPPLPREK